MKQIMIVKPKTLSSKDKEKLTKNGIVIVEHPFPGDVRIITESDSVETDHILQSAMKAINSMGGIAVKSAFFDNLHERTYKPKK